MRVLLDENIPHLLRNLLPEHDVRTTAFQGWSGLSNGDLLRAAEAADFQVVITADQNVNYQQNRSASRLALVVVSSNREDLRSRNLPALRDAIEHVPPGGFTVVRLE